MGACTSLGWVGQYALLVIVGGGLVAGIDSWLAAIGLVLSGVGFLASIDCALDDAGWPK